MAGIHMLRLEMLECVLVIKWNNYRFCIITNISIL